MKYYLPILCVVLLGLGTILGAHYKEKEIGGLFEQSVIREAAYETRLHTVVLTRLREGKTQEAITTLENSLGVKEALLETCVVPPCSAASSRDVIEAKELINNYRKNYHRKEQR